MNQFALYALIMMIGISIGSFLNVLIYRIPRKKKFIFGRSFCPECNRQIKFYDNIPILSFLLLRGKCRACGTKISLRYPLVEFLNGTVWTFFVYHYGFGTDFFVYSLLTSALIVIFFIDLDFQIIPDTITIPGTIIGLAAALLPDGIGIIKSVIGMVIGGGALYLIAVMGDWVFKKDSMGGGDIKMAAMLGAFLGWQKVIFIFFAGAVVGLLVSIVWMVLSKKVRSTRIIPFGPFLAIAAFIAIVYGDSIITFYLNNFLMA